MFDIGFSELFICAVIALIVLGPERLPGLARTVGRWSGQARAYMRNLSAEIEREVKVQELRKQVEDANRSLREHTNKVQDEASKLGAEARGATRTGPEAAPVDERRDETPSPGP